MTNELTPQANQIAGTFTAREIEVIKTTICPGISNEQLDMFLAYCRRTGLDPIARQIYATLRSKRIKGPDGKWTEQQALTIQTSIDGFRLVAERTGKYAGQTEPQWCGPDGIWRNVWLSNDYPAAARVGVLRSDFTEPMFAVATWSSYCQYVTAYENGQKVGEKVGDMWQKMPDLMLSKVAEALALRKAFPNDLAGVYTGEEMAQASNEQRHPAVDRSTGEVLDAEDRDEHPTAPQNATRNAGQPRNAQPGTNRPPQPASQARVDDPLKAERNAVKQELTRMFGNDNTKKADWLGAQSVENLRDCDKQTLARLVEAAQREPSPFIPPHNAPPEADATDDPFAGVVESAEEPSLAV
jgi:phage recombination protein Bet